MVVVQLCAVHIFWYQKILTGFPLKNCYYPFIGILGYQGPMGLISSLYTHLIKVSLKPLPSLEQWRELIPTFQEVLASSLFVSPVANNTQIYIIHQCYLTPLWLHRMGWRSSPACIPCTETSSDVWHMIGECQLIQGFWREVVDLLSEVLGGTVPFEADICFFGILDQDLWHHHIRLFLRESIFFGRKAIILWWMDNRPPSLS